MLYCCCLTANNNTMTYSRILIISLFFSFLTASSQEISEKNTLIKQLEGIKVSYSKVDGGKDYMFHFVNKSANAAMVSWDVKIFYSETDSKEIHKIYKVPAHSKKNKALLGNSNISEEVQLLKTTSQPIIRIEIHNFDFKGIG